MKHFFTDKQPVIFVLGDLMIDHYIWGDSTRISPEAPVQVVHVKNETNTLGGALNVANNLVSLGAKVFVGGVLGNDNAGKIALENLSALGINTDAVSIEQGRPTTQKSRVVAANQQIVRFDTEETHEISSVAQSSIIDFVNKNIEQFDILILSDYAKGVLTAELCQQIISIAKKANKKVLVDPKGKDFSKYKNAYLITPNKKETTEITGIDINDETSLIKAGAQLQKNLQLDKVIMTLGDKGIAVYDGELHIYPTITQEVYDVTGAGDTVLAALSFALSTGNDIHEACKFANAAAAVVVGKIGCATATPFEIVHFFKGNQEDEISKKIIVEGELDFLIKSIKAKNKKIVFTNGCFDILHAGHVSYLQKARQLGDILIVGLNSDKSVKRLKGEGRPINTALDRAAVLAGLSCIDFIVIFEEDTPFELIKKVKPDVLVKGADYKGKEVIGSDIAKEVVLIDFVEGKSTSDILKRQEARKIQETRK